MNDPTENGRQRSTKRRAPVLSTKVATRQVERSVLIDKALQLYLADFTYREIGRELNVSIKTVHDYIHLGLRQLGPSQETRRLRDTKLTQLLGLSRTLLPTAMGEGRVKLMDSEGDVLSVPVDFAHQERAAKLWLTTVQTLVKVSGIDEVNRMDAAAARPDPESMGLGDVDRELAEFAELLRIQPGRKSAPARPRNAAKVPAKKAS